MTLKADMLSDLDDVFLDTDEHAVEVTYNAATIIDIFDDEFSGAANDNISVETTVPQVLVKTSDVPSVAHGETMTINSIAYKVIGKQPDGTGVTLILLSQDT